MSIPFTSVSGATLAQLLSEITLAYSERRQAIGQSAYIPELRKVQPAAYWRVFQNWLEANIAAFIDWKNGPLDKDRRNYLYFTLAAWRAAAGLNAAGFRRLPYSASSFQYGVMQVNDAIGHWVFEEIQRGLGALRVRNIKIIASITTIAGSDPVWDLTPYHGPGIGVIDGTVGFKWAITGRGMVYGVQNDGDITDTGVLKGLPNSYTADAFYDGEVNLEVWYLDSGTYKYDY